MALSSLRLRGTLSRTLSNLSRSLAATPAIASSSSAASSSSSWLHFTEQFPAAPSQKWSFLLQSRAFRSSSPSLFSSRSPAYGNNPGDEIGPDTILFEGCDYNHWLMVMDFPKDPRPTAEEMVRTYEETCARGLNISVEEAKKKMYACSTTTYTGFQAVMTEEESEKFNGLPGVIFVLPDSYIDPQNKEYGGDKYINGTIIPRPPPVQFGRQQSRYRDRNRSLDRQGPVPNQQGNPSYGHQGRIQGGPIPNQPGNPSYGHQGPMQGGGIPNQPGSPSYGHQGPMQGGGRNYGPTQNYPSQQNYGPPGQGERRDAPGSGNPYQQGSYNQRGPGYFPSQVQRNWEQGDQRNYAPSRQQGGFQEDYGNHGQGVSVDQGQGFYRQEANPGSVGQGTTTGYGQSSPGYGHGQSFLHEEQRNAHGEPGNYPPMGQTRTDQGRY